MQSFKELQNYDYRRFPVDLHIFRQDAYFYCLLVPVRPYVHEHSTPHARGCVTTTYMCTGMPAIHLMGD